MCFNFVVEILVNDRIINYALKYIYIYTVPFGQGHKPLDVLIKKNTQLIALTYRDCIFPVIK